MAGPDTAPPSLTSLTLPATVDVTSGGTTAIFSAGATDVGTGVDRVAVLLDRSFDAGYGLSSILQINGTADSYSDGVSSVSQFFGAGTSAGTYNITALLVYDNAGNVTRYSTNDLTARGIVTSFQVASAISADTAPPSLTSLTLPATVDVTSGGTTAIFSAGATDVGTGVDRVAVLLDRSFDAGYGLSSILQINGTADSYSDGVSSVSQFFGAGTSAGTYNITALLVYDNAGNVTRYSTNDLTARGIVTSFQVASAISADTAPPSLTSLTLPATVDVTSGGTTAIFSAGATDVGTGVDRVAVLLDRSFDAGYGLSSILQINGTADSYSDGVSSVSQFFGAGTSAGTYNITALLVYDSAGNVTRYSTNDLTARGIVTNFQIVDRNVDATASITAPSSVIEGNDASAALSLTLRSVGTASTNVTVSIVPDQSTVTNGADVSVPNFTGSYSVSQSPAGNYVIALPSIAILDDFIGEGNETITVRIQASGQVFDTGTDTTTVTIALIDNDFGGLPGGELVVGTANRDSLFGLGGDDFLVGNAGADLLVGGSGADGFAGTTADLAGDRIGDFEVGDRIRVSDSVYATFGFVRTGSALSFGGVAMDIGSPNARLVLAAGPVGGTDLIAVNRYSGLSDFGGDGHSDILFQNVGGAVSSWSVAGNVRGDQLRQNSYFANVDASWNVVETFDMNGDGRSDILWRNANGSVAVWQANGGGGATGFDQGSYLTGSPGASWQIAATGDINGDGRDDMLWRNDDGAISAWNSTGAGFAQNSYFHASVGTGWRVAGLADFNGDGRDDILWRESGGSISQWLSTGTGFVENGYFDGTVTAASGWKIAALADFNGDGRDDMLWRNDNGAVSVWQSAASGGFAKNTFAAQVDTSWTVAQAGDFNADGAADLLWRNAGGAISIWQSNGNGFDQNVLFDPGPAAGWTIQAHDILF